MQASQLGSVGSVIYDYLKATGLNKIAEQFKEESITMKSSVPAFHQPIISSSVISHNSSGSGIGASALSAINQRHNQPGMNDDLERAYNKLHQWISSSLDIIRDDLIPISFALFVHVYLDLVHLEYYERASKFLEANKKHHIEFHADDILALSQIVHREHLNENEVTYASKVRKQKFVISLSALAKDVFFKFLFDDISIPLLSLVNRYIEIRIKSSGLSAQRIAEADASANLDSGIPNVDEFNKTPISIGIPQSMQPLWYQFSLPQTSDTGSSNYISKNFWSNYETNAVRKIIDYRKQKTGGNNTAVSSIQKIKNIPPSISFMTFDDEKSDSFCCVDVSWDATVVAGGYDDSRVRVWHAPQASQSGSNSNEEENAENEFGQFGYTLVGHSGPVYATSISPDNNIVLSCSEDGSVRLWQDHGDQFHNRIGEREGINNRWLNKAIYSRENGTGIPIWDVKFAPFGRLFATASNDRAAYLWITDRNEAPIRMFMGHSGDVDCVNWHPNSKFIVTGSSDKTARMFDLDTGNCVRVFSGSHVRGVSCVSINPQGDLLATGSLDHSIAIWDIKSGKRVSLLEGHEGAVLSLSWSPDSTTLLSGGADYSVRLWDCTSAIENFQKAPTNGKYIMEPQQSYFTRHTNVMYLRYLNPYVCVGAGGFSI